MKKFSLIFALIFFLGAYSQEYTFNKKIVSVKYTDSKGNKKYTVVSNTNNEYKFKFEKAAEPKHSPLIYVYNDSDEIGKPYNFAFSKKYDNIEIDGKIFEQSLFFSFQRNDGVIILFSFDKTRLLISYQDKMIEYIK